MAVVSVKERSERQRSSTRDGKTTHTRVFLVECSDIADGTATALTADDGVMRVPGTGDYYKGIPFSGKDVERVAKSAKHYEVTVEFAGSGEGTEADDIHPLDLPAEVSFGADNVTEPYFLDHSDPPRPVVMSTGEAPEQFLERERGELVITFVVNVPWWSAVEMEGFGNTINAEAVVIEGDTYPPETLRLLPPTANRQIETVRISGVPTEVVYWRATFVLKARAAGWNDKLLDVGYSEIVEKVETVESVPTVVKKLQPIYDRAYGFLRRPWPLNGGGTKLLNPTDTPAELEFKPYIKRSWAALYF